MSIFALGMTFGLIGKVMLWATILMVHHKMEKEHKIDSEVIKAMHKEKFLTCLAVALIIVGYILEMHHYF